MLKRYIWSQIFSKVLGKHDYMVLSKNEHLQFKYNLFALWTSFLSTFQNFLNDCQNTHFEYINLFDCSLLKENEIFNFAKILWLALLLFFLLPYFAFAQSINFKYFSTHVNALNRMWRTLKVCICWQSWNGMNRRLNKLTSAISFNGLRIY